MDSNTIVQFKKLHPDAIIPTRATDGSVGWDLYALEDSLIVGGAGNVLVPTGIAVQLPFKHYGRVAMRSGLAVKQHLSVSAGVIDLDYSGPLGVVVFSSKVFDVKNAKRYSGSFDRLNKKGQMQDPQPVGINVEPISQPLVGHLGQLSTEQVVSPYETKTEDAYVAVCPHAYCIRKGERFAQLIIEKASYAPAVEVAEFSRECGTYHGGFGSTGK